MGCARTAFGLLLSLAVLAGCSTTDALTPPVDVGGGRFPNSPPVTDRDLQNMADTQQPVYPANQHMQPRQSAQVYDQPVQSQPVEQQEQPAYRLAKPGPGAPPATLDQQAARTGGQRRQQQAQPEPREEAMAPAASSEAGQQPAASQASGQAGQQTASTEKATIRFLPIIGAPLEAVTPLSRQLGTEARNRGYVIKSSSDTSASHVLKGYFSAVAGGGSITVTYVWDILDNNGARLNRIQGQENFPGTAADPWTAVPPSVMQTIAAKTMDNYARWQAGP